MYLAALFIGPGTLVLLHCLDQIRRGRSSLAWPSVLGLVEKRFISPSVFLPSDRRFTYTYKIGDEVFTGRRILFGSDIVFGLPNPARTWRGQHYLPGSEVRVRYNPRNPRDSVLQTGVSPGTYVLAAVASLMLILGLVVGSLVP